MGPVLNKPSRTRTKVADSLASKISSFQMRLVLSIETSPFGLKEDWTSVIRSRRISSFTSRSDIGVSPLFIILIFIFHLFKESKWINSGPDRTCFSV